MSISPIGEELGRRAAAVLALHLDAGVDVAHQHLAVDGRGQRVGLRHRVDVAGAQEERLLPRALDLGLGLAPVVLGCLEVGRRAGLLLEEVLLALVVVLGGDEVGLGLVHVADGVADVGRLDDRERVALLHALAELGGDLARRGP